MSKTIPLGGMQLPIMATPMPKLIPYMDAIAACKEDAVSVAAVNALNEAIFAGIRRAKGEVTLEFVQDNIDFTNFKDVMDVFHDVNGMKRKAGGATGEAGAGAP